MNYLLTFVLLLVAVGWFTLLERYLLGLLQIRLGPNKPGVIMPLIDAIKLLTKGLIIKLGVDTSKIVFLGVVYILTSFLYFTFFYSVYSYFMLLLFLVGSLFMFPTLLLGWFSSSIYAWIGAQRGLAQMLSYEVGLIVIAAVFMLWNMSSFSFFLGVAKYPWLVFLLGVCILAELNRAPFDFMEGESELVSGFNIEMGSVVFMAFFFGEMIAIMYMSYFMCMLCDVTWLYMYIVILVILVRGAYPRTRYDFMMNFFWGEMLFLLLLSFV